MRQRPRPLKEKTATINASDSIQRRAEVIVDMLPIGMRAEIRDAFVANTKHILEEYAKIDVKASAGPIPTRARSTRKKPKVK